MVDMVVLGLEVLAIAAAAALILAILAVGIAYPAGVVESLPRLRWFGTRKRLELVAAWCPALVIGLFGIVLWFETPFYFPHPDYYKTAAEVIPIVFVALIIERSVLASFSARALMIYGLLFATGEAAALLAISQSLKGSDPVVRHYGGPRFTSEAVAVLTSTALLAAGVLAAAAVVARGIEGRSSAGSRSAG